MPSKTSLSAKDKLSETLWETKKKFVRLNCKTHLWALEDTMNNSAVVSWES